LKAGPRKIFSFKSVRSTKKKLPTPGIGYFVSF